MRSAAAAGAAARRERARVRGCRCRVGCTCGCVQRVVSLGLGLAGLAGGLCDGGNGGGARDCGGAEGGGSVVLVSWWQRAGLWATGYMLVLVLVVSLCWSDDTQSSSTFF